MSDEHRGAPVVSDMHRRAPDAVVVGAGRADLACALDLCRTGRRVALPEASDGVGGRMRADRRNGSLLDRGFQVFNTLDPQVNRRLGLRSLRLRPFTASFVAHTTHGPVRLAAPAALTARDAVLPASTVRRRRDRSTSAALSAAGMSDDAIADVLRPFLAGAFLEDRLKTSARFFHLVRRSTVSGTLCLPADGSGAVPARPADGLHAGVLRLGTPVAGITDAGTLLGNGGEVPARAVVVATAPATAARLLPDLTVPDTRTVTTCSTGATPLRTQVLRTAPVEPTLAMRRSTAPVWPGGPCPVRRWRPVRCRGPIRTAPTRATGIRSPPARSRARCPRCSRPGLAAAPPATDRAATCAGTTGRPVRCRAPGHRAREPRERWQPTWP